MKSKSIKKWISVLMAAVMLLSAAPLSGLAGTELPSLSELFNVTAEAESFDMFTYTIFGGKVTITGCDGNVSGEIIIPSEIEGYPVVGIGDNAFQYCENLSGVTIPDSVTSIGEDAFYDCENLTSITIPDSVTSIGEDAFRYCTSLTSVTIGNSVTSIGEDTFYGCENLTSITIPDSVTSIGDWAFYYCSSLTSITIPDSVTSIGDSAFSYCSSLTSITIPDSVTSIDDSAFYYCTSLTSITIPGSVKNIESSVFHGCSSLTNVVIKNGVASIGTYAFYACTSLKDIEIPDSVMSIGQNTFGGCSSLTSITIPDSVASISGRAFERCFNLTSFSVSPNNKSYSSDSDGVLYNKDQTFLIKYPIGNDRSSYEISNSVKSISDYAFCDCDNLTSIIIPDSVTSIAERAFDACSGLTSVSIGNSVTSIGDSAFSGCNSLISINIPDSVTRIGNKAFLNCDNLTSLTIPDSVTNIGDSSFRNCDSLTKVVIGNGVEKMDMYAFAECELLSDVTISQGAEVIGYGTFYNCPSLTSIVIPESVKEIRGAAFARCDSLKSIMVDKNNKYFSNDENGVLFDKDKTTLLIYPIGNGKTSCVIPDSVTAINEYAFYYHTKLTSVRIPGGVTEIGLAAFYNCTKLASITIPDSVTSIGEGAFERCGLKNVEIGKNVALIGNYAFDGCDNITDVYYTGTESEWDNITFSRDNDKLLNATIHFNESLPVNKYTVTYNANGGEVSPTSAVVEEGKSTELPTPAKSYKITYDANGGSVSMLNKTVNCTFKNWNTNSSGTGMDYNSGTNYTVDSNITLYAQWTNPTCGTLPTPTKLDCTFDGWYTSATGGTKVTSSTVITADTTLYAQWTVSEQDIYNLGEETYRFNNFGDSDSAGGHCFGMSITSSAYHLGILDITAVGGNKQDDVYALSKTDSVKEPICYYQDIQGTVSSYATVAGGSYYLHSKFDIKSDWNSVVDYVKDHSYDNKGSLQIGYRKENQGGHAINFLRYEEVDGQPRIYAYDNNFPNVETYFYMDSDGNVYQAPKRTFSGPIDCIALRSVEKYYSVVGSYDSTRAIYADKGMINVIGAASYAMDCGVEMGERVVFEVPAGVTEVQIVPLTDNAEFTYLGYTYSFGSVGDDTVGTLTLASSDEQGNQKPQFTQTEKELVSISIIYAPSNVNLAYKESVSTDGLQVIAKYSDESEVDVTDKVNVKNFDTSSVGSKTATVEFEQKTATFDYEVSYTWWQWIIIIVLFGWLWY